MNAPDRHELAASYTEVLPYVGAPDNEARLERLEQLLRKDEEAIFVVAETALRPLNGKPTTRAHVLCLALIARWHYFNFNPPAAHAPAIAAVAVARSLGTPLELAKALKIQAVALNDDGKPDTAIPVILEGLENARLAGDTEQISQLLNNLGTVLAYSAQHGMAIACYEQALALNPIGVSVQWTNKAYLLLEIGDVAAGLEAAQRSLSLIPNIESVEWGINRLHCVLLMTQSRAAIGDLKLARQHALSALEVAPLSGELGQRLARLASLLVDAYEEPTSDVAIESLICEVKRNKPSFNLYRISLRIAVNALQAANRPEQALRFLREIAELEAKQRTKVISQPLPLALREQVPAELDDLAEELRRKQFDSLLTHTARSNASLDRRLEDLLAMAIRAELREEEAFSTGEHCYRVARLAQYLADEACCSKEETRVAYTAALLHDLGKTFAPDQVLLKRRALTDKEKSLLRRHSEDGALLIESLKDRSLNTVAAAVRHSHERWDGTGYPSNLHSDAIPIEARIIALCDSFDAMTHWRVFRSPRSFVVALSEIEAGAGSRYDPRLSRLFVRLLRRLRRETDDLDRLLADGAENSAVVQEQRRLARLLRPQRETL
jgi:HD-GYP domain-containing protein (c-di-GMP phosphodiesterase class II)